MNSNENVFISKVNATRPFSYYYIESALRGCTCVGHEKDLASSVVVMLASIISPPKSFLSVCVYIAAPSFAASIPLDPCNVNAVGGSLH